MCYNNSGTTMYLAAVIVGMSALLNVAVFILGGLR
jgi:hypothetical protein